MAAMRRAKREKEAWQAQVSRTRLHIVKRCKVHVGGHGSGEVRARREIRGEERSRAFDALSTHKKGSIPSCCT
eukprot:6208423-Pleurochrysis_carterae.AAC.1